MLQINLNDLIVVDIETVPVVYQYDNLDEDWQQLWRDKTERFLPENLTNAENYANRAGVMAEFSKIVCIGMGYFNKEENWKLVVKNFAGDDEKLLLQDFLKTLDRIERNYNRWFFTGHNIKEFDIPFIARRMIINQMPIPDKLNLFGKKPWEIPHLDTLELWKFGDYKHFTSLKLLTKILGVPSPKGDIDGSQVAHVYYVEKDIDRIITYCEKDTIAVAQILLRLRREDLLIEDEIIHV